MPLCPELTMSVPQAFDIIINNGLFFDGRGSDPLPRSLGIRDGLVAEISETPLPEAGAGRVIDATDRWITPGFVDLHTHYDAELEVAPSLSESVRHGVTTIFMGSCSLGACLGRPEDIADIFCRVEGVPREIMLPVLEERKDWDTLGEYFEHLDNLPLGPNVASFVGHSNLRMHVMGFDRSVQPKVRPSKAELKRMETLLEEGLDLGYLGMSIQTLPWDKLDGDRWPARPLPSYFAPWSEYRRFTRILRRRNRVFQGVPNVTTKVNVLLFLAESAGLFRKPLRTTIISLMDIIADRKVVWLVPLLTRLFNRFLRADFRLQALPNLFDVWSDGMQLVIFEEFGAGTEAINHVDLEARAQLLQDPDYRKRFRRQWTNFLLPKVYHRDFQYSEVLACPDASVVGRSFADISQEQGRHVVDVFLDLAAEHGEQLRWYSVMANDRTPQLEFIAGHPDVLIGFSDAGAHLRNMAHYNFPLRMLKLARDAELRGEPFISLGQAVHRVTGEIAQWFDIDAGILDQGRRADLVVINPERLDESLDEAHEAPMERFGNLSRLVRRNDATVDAVLINGKLAVEGGQPTPMLGEEQGFGRVLRAGESISGGGT
ncbi:MAG: N-acyl-D-glutamate amidohydrolase, partial [Myxococcota bacterium]|nr:N-acyl-D-glutamate amidohydrolase [Myxococcota bacterium]